MKIRLQPDQPAWKNAFEDHRALIAAALSPLHPAIDHIGSTALGDIAAILRPTDTLRFGRDFDSAANSHVMGAASGVSRLSARPSGNPTGL